MPLFVLISGYVTRCGKRPLNAVLYAAFLLFSSAGDLAVTAVNYIITVFRVSLIIMLLSGNRYLNLVLFGIAPKKVMLGQYRTI